MVTRFYQIMMIILLIVIQMMMMHLFLWTALVPIKMVLRWTLSLKYFIGIPEWFFNV